eukprot:1165820-Rhodomonas_salina.1
MSILNGETPTMGPDTELLRQWLVYKIWMQGELGISWGLAELEPTDLRVTAKNDRRKRFPFIQWTATRAVHITEDEIDLRIVGTEADQARPRVKGGKSKMYSRESAGPTATRFNAAKFHQPIHLWVVRTKLKRKEERAEQERVAELI